jgi:uncharacterized protein YkwD
MHRRDAVGGLIVVLLVMALGAGAALAAKRGAGHGCSGATVLTSGGDVRGPAVAAILCHVNRQRAMRGRAPVRLSQRLSRAAILHSQDMTQHTFFSHTSSNGMNVRERVARTGYLRDGRSLVAETLAWGSAELAAPAQLVRALMGSPSHKQVVLDPRFRDVGVGLAGGVPDAKMPGGGATLTLVFGRR